MQARERKMPEKEFVNYPFLNTKNKKNEYSYTVKAFAPLREVEVQSQKANKRIPNIFFDGEFVATDDPKPTLWAQGKVVPAKVGDKVCVSANRKELMDKLRDLNFKEGDVITMKGTGIEPNAGGKGFRYTYEVTKGAA
jgi:hypothetical protein